MTMTLPLPYRRSRALAQGAPLFAEPGVALELVGLDLDSELYAAWRRRVECVMGVLGWPAPQFLPWPDGTPQTLGFTAPGRQLQTARRANEWAVRAAVLERDPLHWGALRAATPDDPGSIPGADDAGQVRATGAATA